jgi:SAM-dependent methyltransferase
MKITSKLKAARQWSYCYFMEKYGESVWEYLETRFEPIVSKYINGNKIVLDAACGFNNVFLERLNFKSSESVGVDINDEVRGLNKIHRKFIICDLHYLRSEKKFETIISLYTWEHLQSPAIVLRNFFELLEKGGTAIIIAPQRWYYVSLIERILPSFLKNLAWKIMKQKNKMPYPTYFKLCTKRSLSREAQKVGFTIDFFKSLDGPPI